MYCVAGHKALWKSDNFVDHAYSIRVIYYGISIIKYLKLGE